MANAKAESAGGIPDVLKWIVAIGVLAAAMVGFYYFAEHSLLLRVVVLLAATVVACLIASQTEKGRETWGFLREARTEVRKVVWPTRRETWQTTLIVIVVVAIVAVILWAFDGLLTMAVRWLLGTGG